MTEQERREDAARREEMAQDALPMLDHKADFPASDRARSPKIFRKLGRLSLIALAIYSVIVLVLPWQQQVRGNGEIIAFDPLERPQVLEAPLSGRVAISFVREGQVVERGELLFQMADNDPDRLANLEVQKSAAETSLDAAIEKLAQARTELNEKELALPQVIASADQKLEAAEAKALTAELNLTRMERLIQNPLGGLVSQRDLEVAQLARDASAAEVLQAEADREKAERDARAEIASKRSSVESARSDSASASRSVASANSSFNAITNLEVRAARDGTIMRVVAREGDFLSAGSPLATIVPSTNDRMVELLMDGNDIPLVRPRQIQPDGRVIEGSSVRLAFEGWPAVQFIGWPSVARGTFGGEVIVIDPSDDGTGRFRVLVAPRADPLPGGRVSEWPDASFLRQGAKARGWVLLNRVPLWFEIWRQLNGFPESIPEAPPAVEAK